MIELEGESSEVTNQAKQQPDRIQRVCPGCGSDRFTPVWRKGDLRIGECGECHIYYSSPVEEELASGEFYDRLGVPFYLSPDKLESDYAPVRFKRELAYFRRWCRRGRVLDVGCSTGAFLYRLNEIGDYETTGMDVTGPALDHAESQGVRVLRKNFLEEDFGEQRFEAVTFWAVVEHLTDPLPFLEKAASLLVPGGHCFILVPNRKSLATRILGARYRYIMPDHVNYFSRSTLIGFVERVSGLRVIHDTTTHFNPLVIIQDLRRSPDRVTDERRAGLLKKTTRWKQSPWLAPVRWGYELSERCLARLGLADNLVLVAERR